MIQGTRVNILNADERFRLLIWQRGDCWEFRACRTRGYGYFWINSQFGRELAHRYAYTMAKGPIPSGMVLDHLCRHPWCVRPSHLEAVTDRTNILRGVGAGARAAKVTHCPRGHPYSADNTYVYKDGRVRLCVACASEWGRARYRRLKEYATHH